MSPEYPLLWSTIVFTSVATSLSTALRVLGECVGAGPVGVEQCRPPFRGVIPADSGLGGEQTPCAALFIRDAPTGVGGQCWTHLEPRISQGWQKRGGEVAREVLSFLVLQFPCKEVPVRWHQMS